jgi:hypothetical protein
MGKGNLLNINRFRFSGARLNLGGLNEDTRSLRDYGRWREASDY